MRPPVHRRRRDGSRSLRHPARGEMGLARCARHGGHLCLHLAVEGRRGASARPAALRDHAQILSRAARLGVADGRRARLLAAGPDAGPAAIAAARHRAGQKIQAIISQKITKKIRNPAMVKGSSPRMASPPDTTAMTRITARETPKEISAAFLRPSPAANGSEKFAYSTK